MNQQSDASEPDVGPVEWALFIVARLASIPLILLGIALWASAFIISCLVFPVVKLLLPARPWKTRLRTSWTSRVGTRNA